MLGGFTLMLLWVACACATDTGVHTASLDNRSADYVFSLRYNDLTRTYKVHVPPSYNEKVPTPAVLYLHGGGGSLRAAYKDGMDKASDKFGFILVVPAGTGPVPDRLLTWNGGEWKTDRKTEKCCGYAAEHNSDDVGFISKVIDEVKGRFTVDKKRVYAAGHTWPSGSQYLPIDKVGPVSYDISFDQIWEFFEKHSRRQ